MDLPVTPAELGALRVFDCVSYLSVLILFKDLVLLKEKNAYNLYYVLFGLLTLFLFLGCLNSLYIRNSLFSLLGIFPVFIYAKLLIIECTEDKNFYKKVLNVLKLVALISILFLAIQMLVGLKFTFYTELNRNTVAYSSIRYPSFFHDPQKYGQYLVLLSFIFLIDYDKLNAPKLLNYALFFIIIAALLQTGGRSALIALFAGMLTLIFVLGPTYRVIVISVAVVAGITSLFFTDSLLIFNRAKSLDSDLIFRASLWQEAYHYFLKNPFLGIGIGNYLSYSSMYSNNYYITPERKVIFFDHPESGYLLILTELGITGAAVIALFFTLPIIQTVKLNLGSKRSQIVYFFIASILSWLVTFVSVYSLNDKRIFVIVVTFISLMLVQNQKLKYSHG